MSRLRREQRLNGAWIILLLGIVIWPGTPAFGEDHPIDTQRHRLKFSNASARGQYAIVGTYGNSVAQELGTQTLDGEGGFVGSSIVNLPGASGERIVVPVSFSGTYDVNDDGTGFDQFTATLPNGTTVTRSEDFVITKAKVIGGALIATEIVAALREASAVVPGGVFLTHTYTRLPPAGEQER
jgi:hypothetical protein